MTLFANEIWIPNSFNETISPCFYFNYNPKDPNIPTLTSLDIQSSTPIIKYLIVSVI